MGGKVYAKSNLGKGSTFCFDVPIEIHDNECQIFSDIDELKELTIVLYLQNKNDNYKADSFLKYSNIFNMDIKIVNSLDIAFDIALFLDDDIDEFTKNKIFTSNKR